MKKPLIIIFTVILVIHLLVLGLFLIWQKQDGAETEAPGNAASPAAVPEPEIDTSALDRKRGELKKTSSSPRKTQSKSVSSRFYIYKPIPPFDYSTSVTGNIRQVPETKGASAGILVDMNSGRVLWNKNPLKPVPIASMTKLMTALLAFEDIRDGKISFSTPVHVSKKAAAVKGSSVWLDPRETLPFGDLLKAMLIKSANDAAYLVGEKLAGGNMDSFVARMNRRASELGLKHTKFYNPNGMPGASAKEDNVASCEDLAKLAAMLLRFPDAVKITSTKTDKIPRKVGKNKYTILTSTNHLVRKGVKGVDGIKTGYTIRAGSCLTVTCIRDGRRLIGAVTGFKSRVDRDKCAEKLLDWGYAR